MDIVRNIGGLIIFPGFIFSTCIALILVGVDRKIVARMQRRRGPKLNIGFLDLIKLMGKDTIVPRNSSDFLFLSVPIIAVVSISMIPPLIPILNFSAFNNSANIIVIIYLLLIPSIATVIGALSSSSPFATIGVARLLKVLLAYELPLIIIIITVCKKAVLLLGEGTSYSLNTIIEAQRVAGNFIYNISLIPAMLGFLIILPAILGTNTLEQAQAETEIAGGVFAEYSGLHLGLYKLTEHIKVYVISGLFVSLFLGKITISTGLVWGDLIINTLIFVSIVLIISISGYSVIRAIMARYKSGKIFRFYLLVPTTLALLSYVLVSFKL